jgi:hypothetical protein
MMNIPGELTENGNSAAAYRRHCKEHKFQISKYLNESFKDNKSTEIREKIAHVRIEK